MRPLPLTWMPAVAAHSPGWPAPLPIRNECVDDDSWMQPEGRKCEGVRRCGRCVDDDSQMQPASILCEKGAPTRPN